MDEITKTEDTSAQRVSRRAAVKRIGTAGAIAWAAPVLATVNTPAFAQTGSPPLPCPNCDITCLPQQAPCPGNDCTCLPEVGTAECFCHQGTPCDRITQVCTDTSQCPDGWVCAPSCCEGPRCLPPCGTVLGPPQQEAAIAAAGVLTSAGWR